jgi:hypothetical protein
LGCGCGTGLSSGFFLTGALIDLAGVAVLPGARIALRTTAAALARAGLLILAFLAGRFAVADFLL